MGLPEFYFFFKVCMMSLVFGALLNVLLGKKIKHVYWLFIISSLLSFLVSYAMSEILQVPLGLHFLLSIIIWACFVGGVKLDYRYEGWRMSKLEKHIIDNSDDKHIHTACGAHR